ncbi:dTDP-4-dehydrorhamnose reductase [Idiomarina aquatica]|uniref:dTDP-4-dehydrorhamnose reductase n=1 Tax=Idiomarina aquatica TaxID=1327752 RepID=A0AA94EI82_9GAMM|nr:dTDP-4-dehydrorhamnose reductase [Idiomarina aquatica]RUO45762.1 dTDP-4-dehydrorhamnose reductase [Idiomarina aquatica]
MQRSKILVTGGTGQVGFEVARALNVLGEVVAPTRAELDLNDAKAVRAFLENETPEVIVNPAAYTAVDKAESEAEANWQLNAELPKLLADYAAIHRIPLVHFSTDYVYPGDGVTAWSETSNTNPTNAYGCAKLAGDQAVMNALDGVVDHYILRTSWVYSARGNNFMKTMLRLARDKPALTVVDDQIGAPTSARLLASIVLLILLKRPESGVYHAVPNGSTSWKEFAQQIFSQALEADEKLALTPNDVSGITTSNYPTPASRPLNSRLNVTKLERALGIILPSWESELALTLKEYLEN